MRLFASAKDGRQIIASASTSLAHAANTLGGCQDTSYVNNIVINNCTSTLSSDHSIITFDIAANYSFKKTTRYVLDFSKCDFDSLNSYLLDIDFTPCFVRDNINCSWQLFKAIILKATSLFIPKVKLKSHQPPKWFTPVIRHHLNRIHTLRKSAKHNPSPHNLRKLQNEEHKLETLMNKAQTEYESQLFNNTSNNCKFTFRYLHSISKLNCIPQQAHFHSMSSNSPSETSSIIQQIFPLSLPIKILFWSRSFWLYFFNVPLPKT